MKKIMTVEDSTSLRELISFTLNGAKYKVIEAEDGKDALSKLKDNTVDLIITDLNMPRMNGIELTQNLRAKREFRFTPIIFLTTESKVMMKQIAKVAGATGWIVKPFEPDHLVETVKKALGEQ